VTWVNCGHWGRLGESSSSRWAGYPSGPVRAAAVLLTSKRVRNTWRTSHWPVSGTSGRTAGSIRKPPLGPCWRQA